MPAAAPATALTGVASAKLCRMLGDARGMEILQRTLQITGLRSIDTADDLRRFADVLAAKEQGMIKMIGFSLRTEALLRGARVGK
jgi:hypothetical protein